MAEVMFIGAANTTGKQSGTWHTKAQLARPGMIATDQNYGLIAEGRTPEEQLVKAIMEIPGVAGVTLTRYELTIDKALLFAWGEITPMVLDALSGFVPGGVTLAPIEED